MLPAVNSTEYLQLVYRPDLRVLICRWMQQTTPQDLRSGYGLIMDEGANQSCAYWLVDARRREHAANQQDTAWMMEVYFPQVVVRLHQPVFIAYLFAPAHLTDIEANTAIPPLTYFDNRPYQIGRFIEERAALEWLTTCRAGAEKNTAISANYSFT
ncbi:hypothetical protein [Hymenobacter volaticus]|uniref:STAS/SEC14 domain-containing protein n=1 Tax=Hymenobacter volaticus TaxID=2932254 RepID=A0ABY4G5F8_9BACT|nr:hypothetical protein [Hymenobacter volaticus]UOQ65986.1 hypothetical protein MUN86_21130 [Hymenobacter volaticus]